MNLPALTFEDLPHYTYEDYAQWEGRWEIIHGIPFAMSPSPRKKHQEISSNIAFQLITLLRKSQLDCKVYEAMDWQISADTVIRPDVVISCGDDDSETKLTMPPVLVIEILSPATKKRDRGIKYRLYQAAGVKYYCIVDGDLESVEAFQLHNEGFEKNMYTDTKGITFFIGGCKLVLDVNLPFNLQARQPSKS